MVQIYPYTLQNYLPINLRIKYLIYSVGNEDKKMPVCSFQPFFSGVTDNITGILFFYNKSKEVFTILYFYNKSVIIS